MIFLFSVKGRVKIMSTVMNNYRFSQ